MKDMSMAVLEYLYKHKTENNLSGASLQELPNTDGIDYLYSEGYINLTRDSHRFIKKVSLTGKGIDWMKENTSTRDNDTTNRIIFSTNATVQHDYITIKIRDEIYNHIKQYLANKDYFHAVDESYKVVRLKLESITGEEAATKVFNMNAENKKHYKNLFGKIDGSSKAEKDFFRGIGYLHLGVQFLRNEKSHALATTLNENIALHYITLASLAYDLISQHVSTYDNS